MGWRFQKRITIIPGVRLNLSKSGISTSVGVRGASLTLHKHGVDANVGLPGTGISYRTRLASKPRDVARPAPPSWGKIAFVWGLVFLLLPLVAALHWVTAQ